MSVPTPPRTYRFAPLDRSGLLLGLSGRQCAALGSGALAAGWLLDKAAPALAVLLPFFAALAVAFARVGGEPLCDRSPVALAFTLRALTRRHRWFAPIPMRNGSFSRGANNPALPSFLAGLAIHDAGPVPWSGPARVAGVGILSDHRAGTMSGTLRVNAGGFCLADRAEQERLVAGWGDVLGGFCREEGPVSQVRWTESLAPAGADDCVRFLDECVDGEGDAHRAYRELLSRAAASTTGHEVFLTVTIDQRRLRRGGRGSEHRSRVAVDVLLEELRLLTGRLVAAGLRVEAPLSPAELDDVMRSRLDPSGSAMRPRPRSLAAAAGVVDALPGAPLATDTAWSHLRVDGTVHRTFWVAEWPRLEVPPNWIEPLILHPGAVRVVSLIYEPVAPARSRRQVDREATKLASDEEQRSRAGFRIGARHRRRQSALLERESELVAGYGELCFAGFVTVSAERVEALDAACADYIQAAAQAGLELRQLDGRHDRGFLCTLPVGRGVTTRRMS